MTAQKNPEAPVVLEGLADFTNVNSGPVQGWTRKSRNKMVHYVLPSGLSLCGRIHGPIGARGRAQVYPKWDPKHVDTCQTCALFFKDIKKVELSTSKKQ